MSSSTRLSRDISEYKIWVTDDAIADAEEQSRDIYHFYSHRIRGDYRITARARSILDDASKQLKNDEQVERLKARLATRLINRISQGEDIPLIDTSAIDRVVENSHALPVSKRVQGLLRLITRPEFPIYETLHFAESKDVYEAALGWSESISFNEIASFFDHLAQDNLIKLDYVDGPGCLVLVNVKAYEAIEQDTANSNSNRVFVAMWFNENTNALWTKIEDVVSDCGYEPIRIDNQAFDSLIDDEIAANIRTSKFVVADLTHGDDGVRGSVYYEVGFARGLDKRVIHTIRADQLRDGRVAFDLDHYPFVTWMLNDLDTFGDLLKFRIEAMFQKDD